MTAAKKRARGGAEKDAPERPSTKSRSRFLARRAAEGRRRSDRRCCQ